MTTQFFWHIGRYLCHPALGPRKKLPKSSRHNKLRASRKTSKDTKGKSLLAKAWVVPMGEWRRDSPLPRAATAEERGRVGARDSFITCVFGIVLRSADSTVRGLVTSCACRNFFLTPTKFSRRENRPMWSETPRRKHPRQHFLRSFRNSVRTLVYSTQSESTVNTTPKNF